MAEEPTVLMDSVGRWLEVESSEENKKDFHMYLVNLKFRNIFNICQGLLITFRFSRV